MAKEKNHDNENKTKEKTFLYEITGVLCILIAILGIARLGLLGHYLMLIFRFFFGDWYFIFLLLLLILGIYYLIVHTKFSIKSIRYLGISLVIIALLTLTHFSMHEYVSQFEENNLKLTILLYLDYFKNNRPNMMVGGGMIGCLFFYLLYYLLSKIGTIFICAFLIIIGIIFISKKTIKDFVVLLKSSFKSVFGGAFKFGHHLKQKFKQFDKDYEHHKKHYLKSNFLEEHVIDQQEQIKINEEYLKQIKTLLDYMCIFYQEIKYLTCYHLTVFFIYSKQLINYEVLNRSLQQILFEPFLIRTDNLSNAIMIEVNNQVALPLSLKEVLNKQLNNQVKELQISIGIDDRNNIINIEEPLLIVGMPNNDTIKYLKSLIVFILCQKKVLDYEIIIIDLTNNLADFNELVDNYDNTIKSIIKIKEDYEKLLDKLQQNQVNNIEEYNRKFNDKIKIPILIINGMEKWGNYYDELQAFEFILQTCHNIGYMIIGTLTSDLNDIKTYVSSFPYKLFLKTDYYLADLILGLNYLQKINNQIEGFLKYQNIMIRLSLLKLSNEELNKVKK